MRPQPTPARLAVLSLALVANIGFYLPRVPDLPGGGDALPGLDKLVHIGVFALTVWAAGRVLAPRRRFPMGWVVVAALGHALVVEIVQALFAPLRSADPDDVLADVVGIALGVLLWWLERRAAARRPEAISPRG